MNNPPTAPLIGPVSTNTWDTTNNQFGIGSNSIPLPNLSGGCHGILLQWLEHYTKSGIVLLVSENSLVKEEYSKRYPCLTFETFDYHPELQKGGADIVGDLCDVGSIPTGKYSGIICQATLEHVFDPAGAMRNMAQGLAPGGYIYIHTHPVTNMWYNAHPQDYAAEAAAVRFWNDWWLDVPKKIPSITLVEAH